MTTKHNRGRRERFGTRLHRMAELNAHPPARERRHPAIPTYETSTIVVGTEDACLRCTEPIVLLLTGWEHA